MTIAIGSIPTPLHRLFSKGSFDRFIFYGNNVKTINGKDWNIPHIASGGIGNDYSIHIGSSAIIIDNGNPFQRLTDSFERFCPEFLCILS